jgi:very-short-patch-repair endonuclease
MDDALRRELTTLRRLSRVYRDLATKGRRRSTVMRALIDERATGLDPGDSDAEGRIARWLVASGLPKPVQQHRVRIDGRTYRIDLAYPRAKVGIEYDGWTFHKGRTSFDADRRRDNALRLVGWLMLHFTSRSSRDEVTRVVADALALPSK